MAILWFELTTDNMDPLYLLLHYLQLSQTFRYSKKICNFSVWGLVAWYTEALPFQYGAGLSYGGKSPHSHHRGQGSVPGKTMLIK